MCCNSQLVISVVLSSGVPADEAIVIHNSTLYAGGGIRGGGNYKSNSLESFCTVASDSGYVADMAVHEFGHSYGDLCDEYYSPGDGLIEGSCVNCRAQCSDFEKLTGKCTAICGGSPSLFKPDDSLMLSYNFKNSNSVSIERSLRPKLQYFIGLSATTVEQTNFERVLAWAEQRYSNELPTTSSVTSTALGYYYRYYLKTNTYVGLKDSDIYYYPASFGSIPNIGKLVDWTAQTNTMP